MLLGATADRRCQKPSTPVGRVSGPRHIIEADIIRFAFEGAGVAGAAEAENEIEYGFRDMAHRVVGQLMPDDQRKLVVIVLREIHQARCDCHVPPVGKGVNGRALRPNANYTGRP